MITIDDIKNMNAETVVPEPIEVELLDVWERKEVGGKWPTTKQRAKLAFPGNNWIIAEFEGHPDQKRNEGKTIRICPGKNREGNPTSLIANDNEYNGKTYRNLRITKAAKVYVLGEKGSEAQANADSGGSGNHQQPASQSTSRPTTQTQQQSGGKQSIGLEMNRLQNFYIRCLQGTQYIAKHAEVDLGISFTPEQFQATTASLYIQGTREGLHKLEKHGPWGANDGVEEPKPQEPAGQAADDDDDIPF